MAETLVLQAALAEQSVKTLQDGEKGGGMKLEEQDVIKRSEVSLEEKENKEQRKDAEGNKDSSMQLGDSSPCSSADVSLNNESPVVKLNGSDGPPKEGSVKKRRRPNKHKGGKNHRKAWKPYSKLSWDEKRKRDDKETLRATKKRDELFASGLPMAPYNTTQFLMEDQDQPSPQAPQQGENDANQSPKSASASFDSSEGEFYDSPDDEDIFMVKEFSEAYENYHAERLQDLTKAELVKEYIELETKNEELEKRVKEKERSKERSPSNEEKDSAKLQLEEEVKRLQEENAKLARENAFLKVAAGKLKV